MNFHRFFVFFMLFAVLTLTEAAAKPAAQAPAQEPTAQAPTAAELSFLFTRQRGMASNQYAVWIEDAQGRHVKTLYATRFTANGGWKKRETSIPLWVKQSDLANLSKAQVDSITRATPKTGALTYRWDGTDSRNTALPPGNYTIYLEATLRMEKQVLYSAPIRLGQGPEAPAVKTEYSGDAGSDKEMISAVAVKTLR